MVGRRQFRAHLKGNTVFSHLTKSRRWSPSEATKDFKEEIFFFPFNDARSSSVLGKGEMHVETWRIVELSSSILKQPTFQIN